MAVLASPAELQLKTAEARLHELRMLSGERNEYVGGYGGGHLHTSSHAETLELEKERRDIAAEVCNHRVAAPRWRAHEHSSARTARRAVARARSG